MFGNSICFVDFAGVQTDTLRIVSVLDLEHYPTQTDLPLDPVAEIYPFSYAVEEVPDLARPDRAPDAGSAARGRRLGAALSGPSGPHPDAAAAGGDDRGDQAGLHL